MAGGCKYMLSGTEHKRAREKVDQNTVLKYGAVSAEAKF